MYVVFGLGVAAAGHPFISTAHRLHGSGRKRGWVECGRTRLPFRESRFPDSSFLRLVLLPSKGLSGRHTVAVGGVSSSSSRAA